MGSCGAERRILREVQTVAPFSRDRSSKREWPGGVTFGPAPWARSALSRPCRIPTAAAAPSEAHGWTAGFVRVFSGPRRRILERRFAKDCRSSRFRAHSRSKPKSNHLLQMSVRGLRRFRKSEAEQRSAALACSTRLSTIAHSAPARIAFAHRISTLRTIMVNKITVVGAGMSVRPTAQRIGRRSSPRIVVMVDVMERNSAGQGARQWQSAPLRFRLPCHRHNGYDETRIPRLSSSPPASPESRACRATIAQHERWNRQAGLRRDQGNLSERDPDRRVQSADVMRTSAMKVTGFPAREFSEWPASSTRAISRPYPLRLWTSR